MIKVIVFDFDLTLVDSFCALHGSWHDFEKYHQIYFLKIPEKEIWGMSKELLFKKISRQAGNHLSWQEIRDLAKKYSTKHFAHLKIRAKKMLKDFKKDKIKIGIVSYNFEHVIRAALKNKFNKDIKFDFVLTPSKTVHREKYQFLNQVLKKYKVRKKELIFIGDHIEDIKAAKKAGVISAGVATGLFSMKELKKYHPDILIDKLSKLKKYVGK